MGRVYRIQFTAKGNENDIDVALSQFLEKFSCEHVIIEKLLGVVYSQ